MTDLAAPPRVDPTKAAMAIASAFCSSALVFAHLSSAAVTSATAHGACACYNSGKDIEFTDMLKAATDHTEYREGKKIKAAGCVVESYTCQ